VAEFVTPEVWTVPGVLALRRHADANLEALVTLSPVATGSACSLRMESNGPVSLSASCEWAQFWFR
jgi:hypothetical protein